MTRVLKAARDAARAEECRMEVQEELRMIRIFVGNAELRLRRVNQLLNSLPVDEPPANVIELRRAA